MPLALLARILRSGLQNVLWFQAIEGLSQKLSAVNLKVSKFQIKNVWSRRQCLLLETLITKNYDLQMKKGSNCMLLDPFVFAYGGAGGIWTRVHQPFSYSSTCVVVWFGSRHIHRAATRYVYNQHPYFSHNIKVPDVMPANMSYLVARTCGALTPPSP